MVELERGSDSPAAAGERTCSVCRCTNDRACDPPCWWIGPELCSNRDEAHMAARPPKLQMPPPGGYADLLDDRLGE